MNRRHFLQIVAALTGSAAVPAPLLAAAPPVSLDTSRWSCSYPSVIPDEIGGPTLRLYSGTPDGDGALLCEMGLEDPAPATDGRIDFGRGTAAVVASGTARFWRITDRAGLMFAEGGVGPGGLQLSSSNLTVGSTLNLMCLTIGPESDYPAEPPTQDDVYEQWHDEDYDE